MALESQISELTRDETIDANKILDNLLDPKNIDMKTEIPDPITFSILQSIANELEDLLLGVDDAKIKLPITKKLLKDLVKQLKLFLVSWNRKSRTEVTETLKALKEEGTGAKSLFQKLGFGGNQ